MTLQTCAPKKSDGVNGGTNDPIKCAEMGGENIHRRQQNFSEKIILGIKSTQNTEQKSIKHYNLNMEIKIYSKDAKTGVWESFTHQTR